MTAIVGLVHRQSVYMGADSAAVADWDLGLETQPKVFRKGEFLIGYTSSFRMGQLLEHALILPDLSEGEPTTAYMVTHFVNAIRTCLREAGALEKEKEVESTGVFLVGCRGRLFRINSDLAVTEKQCGYDAVGCGSQNCMGAISAIKDLGEDWDPKRCVEIALLAAEKHNIGVRGPMRVISDDLLSATITESEVNGAIVTSNGA